MITSYTHKSVGNKNYFVFYTEDDKKFTTTPYFVDATRIGFHLESPLSTGTYKDFLEALKDFIEFDTSYRTGAWDHNENPVPLLKKCCWEDLSFDNWWQNYCLMSQVS